MVNIQKLVLNWEYCIGLVFLRRLYLIVDVLLEELLRLYILEDPLENDQRGNIHLTQR